MPVASTGRDGRPGFHRGVHVAADAVRTARPIARPWYSTVDDGQVERGEQQIHDAADQAAST